MSKLNIAATRPRDYAKVPGKLGLHNLTVKYKSYGYPPEYHKRRPSELVREKLDLPIPYIDGKSRPKPRIIERHNFFNLPYQVPSSVPKDEPLFQPFPPQITFTGYKAFHKYHATLQLRNNDKVVRRVMVTPLVSEILTVQPYSFPDLEKRTIYDELGTSRVACGMEYSVIVNWCPQDENDFESEVVVITEREKFVVPVICHGLRGVLDIADEIHFPHTPIHFSYKKNVMMKNPGTRIVHFIVRPYIKLESALEVTETFSIEPTKGALDPGEFLELCLEFKPTKLGVYEGELEIVYADSQERVYSRIIGTGIEIFTINPANGELWPGNRLEVIITFSPRRARRYFTIAYCTLSGKQDRQRLRLDGLGVGPLAQFVPTKMDLKELSLYSEYKFELTMQNTGELDATFELESSRSKEMGTIFRFDPEIGCISVGQDQKIMVTLFCNERGKFQESCKYFIQDSVNFAPIYFRGDIGNPSVDVEPLALDFGLVSFGFDCFREIQITNNSNVPLHFKLHLDEVKGYIRCPIHGPMKRVKIPYDCDTHGPECDFSITPTLPTVPGKGTLVVSVRFTPFTEMEYKGFISIHLKEIDEVLYKVTFEAQSKIPKVTLPVDILDYDQTYLRFEYIKPLELLNESQVPAKYKLLPLDYESQQQGYVLSRPREGTIDAFSLLVVDVVFLAYRLGPIDFSLLISISGKEPTNLLIKIKAYGIGAQLKFTIHLHNETKSSGDNATLDFGKVQVLQKHFAEISITNVGLIPAVFQVTLENKETSVFNISLDAATLLSEETLNLQVMTFVDDTIRFKDSIHVTLEGRAYKIPCFARGVGALLVCKELSTGAICFGDVLTYALMSHTISVQNLGRRARQVTWTTDARAGKTLFSICPPKIELSSKATETFVLSGTSIQAAQVEEMVTCTGSMTSLSKKIKDDPEVHNIEVNADVAHFALVFSPISVNFIQINGPGQEELDKMVHPVTCQNVFKKELYGCLDVKLPFRLSKNEFHLQPMESLTVDVILDWQRPKDKLSHAFSGKIEVQYRDTPRKDYVALSAEIHFPNLHVEANKIEFGCVIENTSKRVQLEISNISIMDVQYCWAFIDKYGTDISTTSACIQANNGYKIPTNQIFDILPIRGTLHPGEREKVEFSFYSFPNYKCRALALCEVDGGPSYSVVLDAESSSIKYHVNRYILDFGVQHFTRPVSSRMLSLSNDGGVPFNYELDLSGVHRKSMLQIDPMMGTISSTEKQKFRVNLLAGVPDKFLEHFKLKVEYFRPHDLEVRVEGMYPNVTLGIQRVRSHKFLSLIETAWAHIHESKVKGLMYAVKDSSTDPISEVSAITTLQENIRIQRHPRACITPPNSNTEHANDDPVSETGNNSQSLSSSSTSIHIITLPKNDEGTEKEKSPDQLAKEKDDNEAEEATWKQGEIKPTVEEVDAEVDHMMVLQHFYEPIPNVGQVTATLEGHKDFELTGMSVVQAAEATIDIIEAKAISIVPTADTIKSSKGKNGTATSQVWPGKTNQTKGKTLATEEDVPKLDLDEDTKESIVPPIEMQEKSGVDIQKIVVNKYVLDFGDVRLGFARKMIIRVNNGGYLPVTLKVDKSKAKGLGFSIEPDRVINLPAGHSVTQTAELIVTFNTSAPKFPVGKIECWVPINIKEGPMTMVLLRANVTTPDLHLSTTSLDFETVQVGHCKSMYVRFKNKGDAPCEWCSERPEPGTVTMRVLKDWDFFTCIPDSGTVPPHDSMNVKVLFTPKLQKLKNNYETIMCIKVSSVQTPTLVTLKGHGYLVPLSFSPPFLKLDPIIPNAKIPAQAQVQLRNGSNQTIEVYSVDFDAQYIKEEEILRGAKGYNEKHLLYMDIREAGEAFWEALVEEHPSSQKERDLDKENKTLKEDLRKPKRGKEKIKLKEKAKQEKGTNECIINGPVIIIYGPPLIGKTTQAKMISHNFKTPIVDLDSLILSAMREGALVFSGQENSPAEILPTETLEKGAGNKKAEDPRKPVEGKPEVGKKTDKSDKEGKQGQNVERNFEADIMNVLKTRLENQDCGAGVVFDGLNSAYVPALTLIKCILQVLGLKYTVMNIQIWEDKQSCDAIVPEVEVKQGVDLKESKDSKAGTGPEKQALKRLNRTTPKNVWTGGPRVNVILLRAEPAELSTYYDNISETCHCILKSEPARAVEEQVTAAPRICQHHLHFQALEGGEQHRTEITSHIHLDVPSDYPYTSAFPAPEEVERYFNIENELMTLLGGPTTAEEADTVGQCVILSTIEALQAITVVLDEEMTVLPTPGSKMPLPEPVILQVIKRPQVRELLDVTDFTYSILTALPGFAPGPPPEDEKKEKVAVKQKTKDKRDTPGIGKGSKEENDKSSSKRSPLNLVPTGYEKKSRWIIPPKTSINLAIQFWSSRVGEFDHAFDFEMLGSLGHRVTLDCTGVAAYPQITMYYMRFLPQRKNPNLIGVKERRKPTLIPILEAQLDFGAIKTAIPPHEYPDIPDGEHCKKLSVHNTGLFYVHVDFELIMIVEPGSPSSMDKSGPRKPQETGKAGGKAPEKSASKVGKKGGTKGGSTHAVYTVHPKEMDLLVNQSSILSLFCYPKEGLTGNISANLLCRVKDNPEPMAVTVTCLSDTPRVELSSNMIDFQRVLIGKQRLEELTLRNTSSLKLKWVIVGIEKLPGNFVISEMSGKLKAGEKITVAITFRALVDQKLDHKLTLQVTHGKEDTVVAQEHSFKLLAEGYLMDVLITFPEAEHANTIDFGTIKVAEDAHRPILLENKGEYPVKYRFQLTGQLIQDLFTIAASEGNLAPKAKLKVDLHFNKAKTLQKETTLHRNCDIILNLIEPLYDCIEKNIPIYISLNAVHTRFLIFPAREINFEYQVCGLLSEVRTMKILNAGAFDLEFKLSAPLQALEAPPSNEEASIMNKKSAKTSISSKTTVTATGGKGKKAKIPSSPKMLDLNAFQLFPAMGTVHPGMKHDISVYFKAPENPSQVHEEIMIAIKDKDPLKYPTDIPFDLKGESLFPRFRTEPEVIFEEHRIVDHLELLNGVFPPRTYSKSEHIYSFGPVFVHTDPLLIATEPEAQKPSLKFSGETDAVKLVSKPPGSGADVNFKFENPCKVPCTVDFTITPEVVEQETLDGYEMPFAMRIQPMTIDIPPLECRYIQCLFSPMSIRTYAAIFEAAVKNGGHDVRINHFRCHLKGEGTLPHIEVESPTELSISETPWLKYPRTKVNQSCTLPIVLHNSGIVPATASILVGRGCDHWLQISLQAEQILQTALPLGSSFNVHSKERETIFVTFTPSELRQYECEIKVTVSSNPFNNLSILVSGEGYMEDVECLGLPKQLSDHIWFEDGPVGIIKTIDFTLKNNCNKDWRFAWPVLPSVKFLPATGHLHAKSTKAMTAVFSPTELVEIVDKEIKIAMYNIIYQGQRPLSQWESPIPNLAMLEDDQAAASTNADNKVKDKPKKGGDRAKEKGSKQDEAEDTQEDKNISLKKNQPKSALAPDPIPGLDVPPEPLHDVVTGSNKMMVLKLHAVADMIRYECEARSIHFKSTMMFQTRTFSFTLKNLSRANLLFHWRMYMQDGQPDHNTLYNICPESGSLPAETSTTIKVKFSPCEVEDCTRHMKCEIPGLDPQWMTLSLLVTGHVTRPWCHFKLPKSDYITGNRRNQASRGPHVHVGPLDTDIRIIEITSLGVNVQNFMTFTALNPTSLSYKFEWTPITTSSQTCPEVESPLQSGIEKLEAPFRCLSKVGEINPGEGYEMNFEFFPVRYELQERFCTFKIPSLEIAVPFLLVGYVKKPKLHFDHAVVNFGKVQVRTKGKSQIMLINCEDIPFPFSFDKATYLPTHSELNRVNPVLLFLPSHGTVAANSKIPITVKFIPIGEGPQNFNVICNLKKSLQLTLNVKGEGYTIHDKIFLEVLTDSNPLQLSPTKMNLIDFGEIHMNNTAFKKFQLINSGIFPFQFVWMLGGHKEVTVNPPGGTVGSEEQVFCELSFCPRSPSEVTDITVACEIRHSNTYILKLCGSVYRPKAVFSFLDYDFGPTFLDAPERDPPRVELTITNAGTSSITCENLFESTPHLNILHATLLIPAGEKDSVFITFKPQEIQPYKEHVKFSINGLDTVTVVIIGEGVGLDVQLNDPTQKTFHFNNLKIGQFSKIPIQLVNKSKALCQLSWAPVKARFLELDMFCLPAEGLLLKGKATGTVDIHFRPKTRISPFNEPFVISAANTEIILAMVCGACTGTEVKLSVNKLAFATVTLGSKLKRKVQVENCGDFGTAFVWDVCTFASECTIFPPEGYLAPHQVATVEVSFHPTAVHPDILLNKIPCVITGGETQFLSITGACIEHDPPVEVLSFIAPVRSTDTKTLQIKNATDRLWLLSPKIENNSFKGVCTVEVPPKGTVGYNICFHPLTMSNGRPHMGSITLPISDGSTLVYKLSGDAGAPLPAGDITYDVMARRNLSISLQVENWLKTAQIFKLVIEQHLQDITTSLTGPKAVEIPGGANRECLLQFHGHRQGSYGYKVTFLNEKTGEYIFYNVIVVVNRGDIVKIIPFDSLLRQRTVHTLHIKNPLKVLVTFTVQCDNPEVQVPATIDINPAASTTIDIIYRPLLEVQTVSYLTLTNNLLGEMIYQLDLTCHATGFDETLTFTAALGSRQTQVFRFVHYLPAKLAYKCELSSEGKAAGFIVASSASAEAADLDGKEVQVPIIFEPSAVGERNYGMLLVQDPKGGKYSCRLLGTCVPPIPQGPVIVREKAGAINFRNVYDKPMQFNYVVDNPAFMCGKGETIGPKKQTKLSVSYKARDLCSDRGRLTISSPEIPTYRWVFYLQGTAEPEPNPIGRDDRKNHQTKTPPPSRGKAKQ